ncbi:unnamed protein product, partial [Linum tenue]
RSLSLSLHPSSFYFNFEFSNFKSRILTTGRQRGQIHFYSAGGMVKTVGTI